MICEGGTKSKQDCTGTNYSKDGWNACQSCGEGVTGCNNKTGTITSCQAGYGYSSTACTKCTGNNYSSGGTMTCTACSGSGSESCSISEWCTVAIGWKSERRNSDSACRARCSTLQYGKEQCESDCASELNCSCSTERRSTSINGTKNWEYKVNDTRSTCEKIYGSCSAKCPTSSCSDSDKPSGC